MMIGRVVSELSDPMMDGGTRRSLEKVPLTFTFHALMPGVPGVPLIPISIMSENY